MESVIQAWPNVMKMLNSRGYNTTPFPKEIDQNYLKKTLAKNRNRIICRHAETGKLIYIVFFIDRKGPKKKIGVEFVRSLVKQMQELKISHAIILSYGGATAFTINEIQDAYAEYTIEIFQYIQFSFCLLEHELVNQPQIISLQEKADLLQCLQESEDKLPKINKATDPVARYLGIEKGQVIKFIRNNGSQEPTDYFRIWE